LHAPAATAVIDIKSGSDPNPINLRSRGVIPVAIISTDSFDATSIDPASVCFGDDEDASQRDCTEAHGTGHPEDVNGEGSSTCSSTWSPSRRAHRPGRHAGVSGRQDRHGVNIEGCDSITTL
jgi:hypothetical protein